MYIIIYIYVFHITKKKNNNNKFVSQSFERKEIFMRFILPTLFNLFVLRHFACFSDAKELSVIVFWPVFLQNSTKRCTIYCSKFRTFCLISSFFLNKENHIKCVLSLHWQWIYQVCLAYTTKARPYFYKKQLFDRKTINSPLPIGGRILCNTAVTTIDARIRSAFWAME